MSSPSSILTPLSPSVSYATTTALPRLTKNQSRYTDTTHKSSKATAYQTVSGAYPSIPTNHKRTPCSSKLHAAAFSPSISTFLEAAERNFFVTWPNLTPKVIRWYLQPSLAAAKGHLNQQQQRRRKPFTKDTPPTPIPTRTHTIYAATLDPKQPTSNSFSDLTGRFPIQSNRGANYIFVLYDYDSNAILVRPLHNRSAHEIQ